MDVQIMRVTYNNTTPVADVVAIEEPLEIRLQWMDNDVLTTKKIAVTMRTPGNDAELALGFLFTEGIISSTHITDRVVATDNNVVTVILQKDYTPQLATAERNFYTTSSCGVCGKASIDAVFTWNGKDEYPYDQLKVTAETVYQLPVALSREQSVFALTGGIHACALFNATGRLLLMREDVGRHNAMDKLVGKAAQEPALDVSTCILLLSGRASFELLQKAAVAGIKIVVAVGAPSSLAIQMAEEWNITLIGFLRGERFNIYSGTQRVVI